MDSQSEQLDALFKPIWRKAMAAAMSKTDGKHGIYQNDLRRFAWPDFQELQKQGIMTFLSDIVLSKMIIGDEFYFSPDFLKFSNMPIEGFIKWSDLHMNLLKGYRLDPAKGRFINEAAPTLNFEQLKKMWFEKAGEKSPECLAFESLTQGGKCYLLDEKVPLPNVFLASFPRSGNSFLRKTLESVTGIATGSNFNAMPTTNLALVVQGFFAENIMDDAVWITKTHFPYNLPFSYPMEGSRSILIVRNPLDSIVSFWHMFTTSGHAMTGHEDFHEKFPQEWKWFVERMSKIYKQYFEYWVSAAKEKTLPVHFVRFEDLVSKKGETTKKILEFLLGTETLEGTYLGERIDTVLASKSASTSYKPRSGEINKNIRFYTPEMVSLIKEDLRPFLHFFGYSRGSSEAEHPTAFFDYPDLAPSEVEARGAFEAVNAEMKAWYLEKREEIDKKRVVVSQKGEGILMEMQDDPIVKLLQVRIQTFIQE